MFQLFQRNPLAVVMAVVMHLGIIAFMIVGVDWLEKPTQIRPDVDVIKARVLDSARVREEVKKLQEAETRRKEQKKAVQRKEEEQLAALKDRQEDEKKQLAELELRRKAEEQKHQELETKRRTEEKRLKEVETRRKTEEKKRLKVEQQRKAKEKKRKEEVARKQAEEKKQKTEARRKAEKERKRKAAAAKKRKAERARKAREAELEAAARAERSARENAREIDRYMVQIKQRVNRNWLRPAAVSGGMKCRLRVRIAPGGSVLAVSVIESSGNGAFDRSAERAVLKADPLPVPAAGLFEQFRDINFIFNPN